MGGGGSLGGRTRVGSLASSDLAPNAFANHQGFADYLTHRLAENLARLPLNPDLSTTNIRLQQLLSSFTAGELTTLEHIESRLLATAAASQLAIAASPFTLSLTLATVAAFPTLPGSPLGPSAPLAPLLSPNEYHSLVRIIDQRQYSATTGQWQPRDPSQPDLRDAPDPQTTRRRRRRRRTPEPASNLT